MKADGPARSSCAELPEIVPAEFHAAGGQDIRVWGTRYEVEADTLNALDYAILKLGLEINTIETPNELLGEEGYEEFKARGGRG